MAVETNDFSLSEYLRRVGAKVRGPVTSPVLEQPTEDALRGTVIRDDVSHLVRVKPVPVAIGGANVGAIALDRSGLALEVRSNGGVIIRLVTSGRDFVVGASNTDPLPNNRVAITPQVTGETEFFPELLSTLRTGSEAAIGVGAGFPRFTMGLAVGLDWFVELGRFFVIKATAINTTFDAAIEWQEIP